MQKSIKEIIQLSTDYLGKAGVESPRVDAEWLIADALDLKRMDLYLQFDRPLDEGELAAIRTHLSRRSKHEPLQYILGNCEFYGYEFDVGPGVLVPRPETELLVDNALKSLKPGDIVLDLCTGSGCIALALKLQKEDLTVFAGDLSTDALFYAQKNRDNLRVDVEFRQGDLFEPFKGMTFDAICTNPPYVGEIERPQMGKDVLAYEPEMALFSDADGLTILKRIAQTGFQYLKPGGFLITEMGPSQGDDLTKIFNQNNWHSIEVIKDYSGRERFVRAVRP